MTENVPIEEFNLPSLFVLASEYELCQIITELLDVVSSEQPLAVIPRDFSLYSCTLVGKKHNTSHIGNGVSLNIVVPPQWRMEEGWRQGGVVAEGNTYTTVMILRVAINKEKY